MGYRVVKQFFDGRLWHDGGSSFSENTRSSMKAYFYRSFMRQQDNISASLFDQVYNDMSLKMKKLIGYESKNNIGRIEPLEPDGVINTDIPWPYIPELRQ